LNLTRLHLGIAHESQFQGLGITHTHHQELMNLLKRESKNKSLKS